MKKQDKKPLVLTSDRVKLLTKTELDRVEGGHHIPPKFGTCNNEN